jgi:hypothetical protein
MPTDASMRPWMRLLRVHDHGHCFRDRDRLAVRFGQFKAAGNPWAVRVLRLPGC